MDQTQQLKGSCVVHVRQDSNDHLEALFNHGLNKDGQKSVPLRHRNLPPSFFQPPPIAAHSRSHSEPILDISQQRLNSNPIVQNQQGTNNFVNNHQRIHSQGDSLDTPLPPGWESRTTASGQKYFINHQDRTTTWEDPRKTQSLTMLNVQVQQQQQQQQQQQHQQQNSLTGLPDGWEQAVTAEGEVYYINHQTKTTSWFHPRQTMQSTSPTPPMNVQNMQFIKQQQQQQQRQQFLMQQQQHQRNQQMDPLLNQNSMINNLVRDKFSSNPLQMNTTGVGIHGRVASVDSGLDGMGSLLTSSSDMDTMNTMDDVDMEGNQPLNGGNQNQDIRLNPNRGLPECFDSMQGTNVDLGILENEAGFDSINNDILGDVDLNPTWL